MTQTPTRYPYSVVKTIGGHPGYGDQYARASYAPRDVVMSRHQTRAAAQRALDRLRLTHHAGIALAISVACAHDWLTTGHLIEQCVSCGEIHNLWADGGRS